MDELKFAVKQWERDFFKAYGRKPSTKDVMSNEAVHEMYRRYKYVSRGLPATPTKVGVGAIDPTPQKTGLALGLFDVELPSSSPVKSAEKVESTPQRSRERVTETPPSKRTPAYLADGGALFVDDDSPLLLIGKRRRSLALRPVPEDTEEMDDAAADTAALLAAESTAIINPPAERAGEYFPESSPDRQPESPIPAIQGPTPPCSSSPKVQKDFSDIEVPDSSKPRIHEPKYRRKGPKRSTRRVVMRPVKDSDHLSRSNPKENFKRLRLQKPAKGRFARRR